MVGWDTLPKERREFESGSTNGCEQIWMKNDGAKIGVDERIGVN